MSELNIKTYELGMVRTNCYIVNCNSSKEVIVIDPGDEANIIIEYLNKNGLGCKGILLTHGHFDHIMAASEVAKATRASVFAHEEEAALLEDPNMNCSSHIQCEYGIIPDELVKDQDLITLAGLNIRVIHTPGHTGGGVCYHFVDYDLLFSGDTLFRDDIGRTDLPTGNGGKLIKSILEKLMILGDQVKVYPGHGEPTTIGYERENNIHLISNRSCWF